MTDANVKRSGKRIIAGILVLAAALAVLCAAVITAVGDTYVLREDVRWVADSLDDLECEISGDDGVVEITDRSFEDGIITLKVRAVGPGDVTVAIYGRDGAGFGKRFTVHPSGVITEGGYFGRCTGGWIIPVSITAFLAACLGLLIHIFRRDMRTDPYQYRNVRTLGLILFQIGLLAGQVGPLLSFSGGVERMVRSALSSASMFAFFALPAAFIIFALVTISNIKLIRNEGRTWRNMLGCILGVVICVSTLVPLVVSNALQWSTVIDVHNEQGYAMYVENAIESVILVLVSYLECVLLATVILGFRAARHVPAFDKDYILILGCRVRKDGTLTPLLRGRVDRAVEFARMQKEATGKDLIFVPSGGQGSDEVVSEAEAMRNYLLGIGIPEEQILPETNSTNTFDNMRFSMDLIRERESAPADGGAEAAAEPNVAFSTTNYHVFRAGTYASKQGFRMEGIGSRTKAYFWVNAFIREFIATLRWEFRTHVSVILFWVIVVLAMVVLQRLGNTL